MTFSWFCQGLLLPLQHHLKVVPFSNIFWGIFTLLSTTRIWLPPKKVFGNYIFVDTVHAFDIRLVLEPAWATPRPTSWAFSPRGQRRAITSQGRKLPTFGVGRLTQKWTLPFGQHPLRQNPRKAAATTSSYSMVIC